MIYTALTRTTCLLVIALVERTPPEVRRLVATLDSQHLLFWDEAAETLFTKWMDEATP